MTAKVDNRVETLTPVEDPGYRVYIISRLLGGDLRDTLSAVDVDANGDCVPAKDSGEAERFDVETLLIQEAESDRIIG